MRSIFMQFYRIEDSVQACFKSNQLQLLRATSSNFMA
ncbi:hypothetical protein SLEP1_g19710 [Rubroshorea leprosula]|uniref:Uncharacterized protein n=1 Tax=Rubroshorea leprosula TaxID=152421 RepID=A0AAV5J080_9ROSI|nr:hypothetical protein SLEP1_g19710 [Rubroshorea leprosula]